MKSTQQNKLQSDNINEEINKMFLELQSLRVEIDMNYLLH